MAFQGVPSIFKVPDSVKQQAEQEIYKDVTFQLRRALNLKRKVHLSTRNWSNPSFKSHVSRLRRLLKSQFQPQLSSLIMHRTQPTCWISILECLSYFGGDIFGKSQAKREGSSLPCVLFKQSKIQYCHIFISCTLSYRRND